MTDFFYDYLIPTAINFGMPIHEFWHEDPQLLVSYKKAYIQKMEMENEINNIFEWRQGVYFYDALSTCLSNAFAKKGTPPQNYMQSPLKLNTGKTPEEIQEEKKEREEGRIKEQLKGLQAKLKK